MQTLTLIEESERIETMRKQVRESLEVIGFGLEGVVRYQRKAFEKFIGALKKVLSHQGLTNHYLLTLHFGNNVNLAVFFHTAPEAKRLLVIFQGQCFVMPVQSFIDIISMLLDNEEAEIAMIDLMGVGQSFDPVIR
jgi:hypothetical protein